MKVLELILSEIYTYCEKHYLTKAYVTKHSKHADLYRILGVVPLINSAICGQNSSFVIAAVFLYPQMLCCLAVSSENDLGCSVQVSCSTDGLFLTSCFLLM